MTRAHVAASVEQAHAAVTRCRCGHDVLLHPRPSPAGMHGPAYGGACSIELPPFEEEELPSWRCPCPRFTPWLPR